MNYEYKRLFQMSPGTCLLGSDIRAFKICDSDEVDFAWLHWRPSELEGFGGWEDCGIIHESDLEDFDFTHRADPQPIPAPEVPS